MEWVASTLHTNSEHVYPALLPLMPTTRLPIVEWTEDPADLNGLVLFAERRNLVPVRVPSHLKRSLLTYSKEKSSSSEGNRFSANQVIPRILLNPKDYYRIHECAPPVPILSQLDSVHSLISYFLNIHLNIIIPPTPGSPKCLFPSDFSNKTLYVSPLPHTRVVSRPSHSRFYHPNTILWEVPIIQFLIM
jgi:hypothetical protein